MNFDGLTPYKISRMGGGVDWDSSVQLPNGIAAICKNSRWLAESVVTRYGQQTTMLGFPSLGQPSGLDVINVLGATPAQIPLIFCTDGTLLQESPPGSGTLIPVPLPLPVPSGAFMQDTLAYNRMYMAFSDLGMGLSTPLVYDGPTQKVTPISQNTVAALWDAGTPYLVGDVARTTVNPNRWFRCQTAGISGKIEPTWPKFNGQFAPTMNYQTANIADGTVQWQEWTPGGQVFVPTPEQPTLVIHNPGSGSISAGKDIYVCFAYSSPFPNAPQQSLWSAPVVFTNTGASDQLVIRWGPNGTFNAGPTIPQWLATWAAQSASYYGFMLSIYVASVTTGSAAPTQYHFYNQITVDQSAVINSIPSNSAVSPPTIASLLIANQIGTNNPAQGIFTGESGTRNCFITRQDLNDSFASVDTGSPFPVVFYGQSPLNITGISRASGIVTCTVNAPGQLVIGEVINVALAVDPTFDGQYTIATVNGATVTWLTSHSDTIAIQAGGILTPQGGPSPVITFPPGGSDDSLDIAAFTVVGQSAAGPFFYIPIQDPVNPPSANVTSISRVSATSLVTATVDNPAGFADGQSLTLNVPFGGIAQSFLGTFTLATVVGNILTWSQNGVDFANKSGSLGTLTVDPILATTQAPQPNPSGLGLILNFDDTSLANSDDITSQLTAIPVPPCVDVYYSENLDRVVYTLGNDSNLYFSNIGDAANIQSPDGILAVASSNSKKTVCFREMISGELLCLKENGAYAIEPDTSGLPPNQWGVTRRWIGHGPVGARAVDVGPDFLVVFTRSGPYLYQEGRLIPIGLERSGTWKRVNWAAKNQIWVVVDDDLKTVRFGLPIDGSAFCNKVMTLDYFNGWGDTLILTMNGEYVANRAGRRWSGPDDIPALYAKRVTRTLTPPLNNAINDLQTLYGIYQAPNTPFNIASGVIGSGFATLALQGTFKVAPFAVGQTVFIVANGGTQKVVLISVTLTSGNVLVQYVQSGSGSFLNGTIQLLNPLRIRMDVPDVYDDDGAGIDWQYQPSFMQHPHLYILNFAGIAGRALGAGTLNAQPVTNNPKFGTAEPLTVDLDTTTTQGQPNLPVPFARGTEVDGDNEMLSYNFNNGAVPGAWASLHAIVGYFGEMFKAQPGG